MQKIETRDIRFMRRALAAAEKGRGRVHPNPLVGAVITSGDKVLSVGAHEVFGGPHAEVRALTRLRQLPKNATLYTTLEPCVHFGKTPPCVDLILKKKIRRVVIATKDPNPLVSGKGIRHLKKAGVRVQVGVLGKEAEELNRDFRHWVLKKRPYVTAKIAQSLDGKSATVSGQSRWITGERSRRFSHELRAKVDAVLVGVSTVLKDNPRLNVRLARPAHDPVRVILDATLRTPVSARIFSSASPAKVFIFTTRRAPAQKRKVLSGKAHIFVVKEQAPGRVDWKETLRILGQKGIVHLLVEGGGEVLASAFQAGIVNEAYFFTAPIVIGGQKNLNKAAKFRTCERRILGSDFLFHGVM